MANGSKSVVVLDVKERDRVRFGVTHAAESQKGHHVIVRPGKSVVLIGEVAKGARYVKVDGAYVPNAEPIPYRRAFKIGESAEYNSFNLCYFGTIIAIGEKTITIEAYRGTSLARKHRLSLAEFSWRNRDDVEEKHARNAAWSD